MIAAVLAGAACLSNLSAAADSDAPQAPDQADRDEIVVTARVGDLLRQLWAAEQAFHDRFNAINSDDAFDVHCYWEPTTGSHILRRKCESNAWRDDDSRIAQAFLQESRGESTTPAAVFIGQQQLMQRRLFDEMRTLSLQDPQLGEALARLGKAQRAYAAGSGGNLSVSAQEQPGADGLPFDARHVLEVRIGRDVWQHPLTERTFTLADVAGDIRALDVHCDQGSKRLAYQSGVEWSVPSDWTACLLRVDAKRHTSFTLYEFDSPVTAAPDPRP